MVEFVAKYRSIPNIKKTLILKYTYLGEAKRKIILLVLLFSGIVYILWNFFHSIIMLYFLLGILWNFKNPIK
jgi:hypothetical protein